MDKPHISADDLNNHGDPMEAYARWHTNSLTRELIEDEGWVLKAMGHPAREVYIDQFWKDHHLLETDYKTTTVLNETADIVFSGTIRNKSELLMIMKMLGVE